MPDDVGLFARLTQRFQRGPGGELGFPTADEATTDGGWISTFDGGVITYLDGVAEVELN